MSEAKNKEKAENRTPIKPYKDEEFEAFLAILEDPTVQAHWKEIAEALNVENDTITRWQQHPRAIEARQKGVAEALKGMKTAGRNDWRMYESKLKMLGISPVDRTDHTSKGQKMEALVIQRPYVADQS